MSNFAIRLAGAAVVGLLGTSFTGVAQQEADFSSLAELVSRLEPEARERLLPKQRAALDAVWEASQTNSITAANFAQLLAARQVTLTPESLRSELSSAFGKAIRTEDPKASLALALQLFPAAFSSGKCVAIEGGAGLQCAVAIVPNAAWATSFDGVVQGDTSQSMHASTLDGFVASVLQPEAQAASSDDPGPDVNSDWRLDTNYDETRCGGNPGPYNEFSKCGHANGGTSTDIEGLPVALNYAAIFVAQVVCDHSCNGWGEIVAVGNAKYLTSSDVVAVHVPVGFYCSGECVLKTAVEAIGNFVEDKVFGDDEDTGRILQELVDDAELRDHNVHPSAVARLHFVAGCPIVPAKYDMHPTYEAPDYLQNDPAFQEYAAQFNMTGFGWGTSYQTQGGDDAARAFHAHPAPTRFYQDILAGSTLVTEYQFYAVRGWAPNVTLATSEFPVDQNLATCAKTRSIPLQSGGGSLSAYGSMIYEFHGAGTPGHSWNDDTPKGLPEVDFAVGFEAAQRLDDALEDTEPDAFTFNDLVDVYPGTMQTSNEITLTGTNRSVLVKVSGGEYSKNGLPFMSKPGFGLPGDKFVVRQQTPFAYLVDTNTELTLGSRKDVFTTRTQAMDTLPDRMECGEAQDVLRNSTNYSSEITVMGINAEVPVYVVGGEYRKNDGPWTSIEGQAVQGDRFLLKNVAASTFDTLTRTHIQVGEGQCAFRVRTEGADAAPDAFSFTDVTGVPTNTVQTSNAISVTGINTFATVTVANGTYSKNGGAYTTVQGQALGGDTFTVRHTSSAQFGSSIATTLSIGGVSENFTSTTEPADTTPNAFSFTDKTNVPRNTTQTSNTIAMSGINTSAAITVGGGAYSKNGGAFTTAAGSVVAGDTVAVQHASSGSFVTPVHTTVTIGGVSDTFTSTTESEDTAPSAFNFTDMSNVPINTAQISNAVTVMGINSSAPISVTGGMYSKNGGAFTTSAGAVVAGDSVAVQHTSSSAFATTVNTTLTIGGVSDTYSSTTESQDTTPNVFTFTDVTNVPRDAIQTSNVVTVSGINSVTSVSVTGGSYSKNSGPYTTSAGTVAAGDTLSVQHTSASGYGVSTHSNLTVGGVSDVFTSTTEQDTQPDAFTFTDVTDAPLNTVQTSNTITVSGITSAVAITVAGGSYSKNGGAHVTAGGTVVAGDTVNVRHTSSNSNSTSVHTTLTIGGVSDTFTSTTQGGPGVLALSSSSYTKLENFNNTLTISVARSGGSGGPASVQYSTQDITADSGDYDGASGTLNWASGESGSKTFTIYIVNDSTPEPDEQFEVILSGASGAVLGSPSTATVTIPCSDGYSSCQ